MIVVWREAHWRCEFRPGIGWRVPPARLPRQTPNSRRDHTNGRPCIPAGGHSPTARGSRRTVSPRQLSHRGARSYVSAAAAHDVTRPPAAATAVLRFFLHDCALLPPSLGPAPARTGERGRVESVDRGCRADSTRNRRSSAEPPPAQSPPDRRQSLADRRLACR